MSSAFAYRGGVLHAEAVPVPRIAEAYGTPFYGYAGAELRRAYGVLESALQPFDAMICFAVKANGNLSVIRTLASLGAGADVVSAGEMRRALAAGVAPDKIIFSGVGKTRAEIDEALAAGIYQFNAESIPELEVLNEAGAALGRKVPVSLRVNPDVDPRTHAKISTGKKETKFGIEAEQSGMALAAVKQLPHINLCGIAMHIGSQLTALQPFDEAFGVMAALIRDWRAAGFAISRLDLGGGLGIRYAAETPPSPEDYAALIGKHFSGLELDIAVEPGRFLVGGAGILVSRVIYAKRGLDKNFLIIDAAMNDLIRPAMYDSWHDIMPVRAMPDAAAEPWDVVGPVCETSDLFARARPLPALAPGDLVAFMGAGAYGAVMASTYNARTLIQEIMIEGDKFALVRRPVKIEEQMSWDVAPVWAR